jgi:hypothetical protein
LRALKPAAGEPCVTLLMTLMPGVTGPRHDEVTFKGLIKTAALGLKQMDVADDVAQHTLAPAMRLLAGEAGWPEGRVTAIALLMTPHGHQLHPIPYIVPDLAVCGAHFYLKPLLPLLTAPRKVGILVVDQHHMRLLMVDEADPHTCHELPFHEDFHALAAAQTHEVQEAVVHVGRAGRRNRGGAVMAGLHGPGNIDKDEPLLRHYRAADQALRTWQPPLTCPLVIAGVGHEVALFRSISSYPDIVDAAISGNLARGPAAVLAGAALAAAAPALRHAEVQALERFDALKHTTQVVTATDAVVDAASQGKVAALFLSRAVDQWGAYDPARHQTHYSPPHIPGTDSLHSLAAELTLLHDGEVFLLDVAKMPEHAACAALLRL